MAEELVLSIDFSRDVPSSVDCLGFSQYIVEQDLVSQDYMEHGRGLANICHESVAKGVKAFLAARELCLHEEAKLPRKHYNWSIDPLPIGRFNKILGNVFWAPPPEIGLGSSKIRTDLTYVGTYRRNSAEGYGCLEWDSGTRYFGQVRDGHVVGYGGYLFGDGGSYFGYWPVNSTKNLGAYISPNKDRVILGVGRGRMPNSYGRQIGLKDGVDSFSAFWHNGEPQHRFESLAETNKKIASSMWSQFTTDLKAEYEGRAMMDEAKQKVTDAAFLTALRPFL